MWQIVRWTLLVAVLAGGWLVWSYVRRTLFSRRVERAQRDFARDRIELQGEFLRAAAATGRPRGLSWQRCDFQDCLVMARDRSTGDFLGLIGATIGFTALEGGGMEEVEAVGNLRAATAVLTWKHGHWTTQGRAIFNLEPHEVLARYRDSLDPI